MDYIVSLKYPKDADQKKTKYFQQKLSRLKNRKVIFKLGKSRYFIDREDILSDFKILTDKFNIELSIEEYSELPYSIKKILETPDKNDNSSDDFIDLQKKFKLISDGYKEFLKVFRAFKGNFKKKSDVLTAPNFAKIFKESNMAAIDLATKEIES